MPTLEAHVVALPMRVPFRGVTTREALLLCEAAGLKQEAIRHLSAYRKLKRT